MELHRYDDAIPALTDALHAVDAADRPDVFVEIGVCLSKLNRFAEAETLFREQVLPYRSDDEYVMHLYVVVLINLGKREEAECINRQLLATDAGNSLHHVVMAKLLRLKNQFVGAWESVQEGMLLDPDSLYVIEEQLSVLAAWQSSTKKPVTPFLFVGVPNWADVVDHALSVAPNNATMRLLAGEVYAKQNKFDAAREHLTDALRLDPSLQPHVESSLTHVLTMQHPLMTALTRPFLWIPETWGVGFLLTVPLLGRAFVEVATTSGMNWVIALLGMCVGLLAPTLGTYLTCQMLLEFHPVGQLIISKGNKWRYRLMWLGLLLFTTAGCWFFVRDAIRLGWFS